MRDAFLGALATLAGLALGWPIGYFGARLIIRWWERRHP